MKAKNLFVLGSILTLFASCDNSSDATDDTAEMNLVKIESFYTNSANPTSNNRKVTYFENNQAVVDSTFDYQDQFFRRTVVTTAGSTKTIKVFTNTGELAEHREENYDSQGRIVGRHTYEPVSALFFTYVYNNDGTVDSKSFNDQTGETATFRTFTKNTEGLLFKQNFSAYSFTTNQIESYEYNADIQNQKLVSVNESGVTTAFQYYPNPMPTNIQKSVNEFLTGRRIEGRHVLAVFAGQDDKPIWPRVCAACCVSQTAWPDWVATNSPSCCPRGSPNTRVRSRTRFCCRWSRRFWLKGSQSISAPALASFFILSTARTPIPCCDARTLRCTLPSAPRAASRLTICGSRKAVRIN